MDGYGMYYCKDDICASTGNTGDWDTIIIPNKEGKNTTYITATCSIVDIDLDLCSSKNCTANSECLSNQCTKGHCSYNNDDPIVQCQYIRIVHDNSLFGDSKGYRMQCGLPQGAECKANYDCSSFNCVKYDYKKICDEPDDGCTSMCGVEGIIFLMFGFPFIVIVACICFFVLSSHQQKPELKKISEIKKDNVV